MKPSQKAYIAREGGKILSDLVRLGMTRPRKPSPAPESQEEASETAEAIVTTQEPAKPPRRASENEPQPLVEEIATACVPCALGHFSTSAGLLNEAVRFKHEGITSNEVLDRIAKTLEEQNTLERVDLTPEKIRSAPDWERDIAEEALQQSRSLRHRLELIESIEELEQAAADTESFYKKFNREWYKRRFAHLGPAKAQRIAEEVGKLSPEDKERIIKRAEEIIEEV